MGGEMSGEMSGETKEQVVSVFAATRRTIMIFL